MEPNKLNETEKEPVSRTDDVDLPQQAEPEPEEELDDLQKRVRAYPEAKWNLLQRIGGALIGIVCGLLLTYFSNMQSIGMYGTIGALLIALFVPRIAEKRLKRSVNKGRIALLSALALWIAAYALIMIARGVPFFTE
jgi:F0F1-type ATP synthase assembly protein I